MVVNPPYGERLQLDNLLQVYKELGSRLKHAFQGNEAWVISSSYDCFDQIGLKASARIPLFNGDLDCEFRKYELFAGGYKGFRGEGNELKKDFAPLKRKSRLTGADGELRPPRTRDRAAESYSGEIDEESMRRRRELESYFSSYKSKRSAVARKRRDEARRDDERHEGRDSFRPQRERRDEGRPERGARREQRGVRDNNRGQRQPRDARGAGRQERVERRSYDRPSGDFKPLRGGKRKNMD